MVLLLQWKSVLFPYLTVVFVLKEEPALALTAQWRSTCQTPPPSKAFLKELKHIFSSCGPGTIFTGLFNMQRFYYYLFIYLHAQELAYVTIPNYNLIFQWPVHLKITMHTCSSTASIGCIGRTSEMDLQLQKAEHLCPSRNEITGKSTVSLSFPLCGWRWEPSRIFQVK